eukprot:maker-scaffold_29-snap-gene-0.48-mRNA-1 protein AED:0.23 eAED:0.23 QI:118/1/1/1/0/0/3/208/261
MFRQDKKSKLQTNSSHTMSWKDRKGQSRNSHVRESVMNSKSSLLTRSMYLAVVLPEKPLYYVEDPNQDEMDINEWLAENTVEFHNEVQILYGVLATDNEAWADLCQQSVQKLGLGYPRNVKYMWKSSRETLPKELPVDVYVDHVIIWANSQIENEDIFPTDEEIPFPENFQKHLKKIYQRIFRIYAIMYSNKCLRERKDVENNLEVCFKHFLFFVWKWELIDSKEWKCVEHLVRPLRNKFFKDQELYLKQQLPYDGKGMDN